jgi:hypothetical protein
MIHFKNFKKDKMQDQTETQITQDEQLLQEKQIYKMYRKFLHENVISNPGCWIICPFYKKEEIKLIESFLGESRIIHGSGGEEGLHVHKFMKISSSNMFIFDQLNNNDRETVKQFCKEFVNTNSSQKYTIEKKSIENNDREMAKQFHKEFVDDNSGQQHSVEIKLIENNTGNNGEILADLVYFSIIFCNRKKRTFEQFMSSYGKKYIFSKELRKQWKDIELLDGKYIIGNLAYDI